MKFNLKIRLNFFFENGYMHGIRYLGERCGYLGKYVCYKIKKKLFIIIENIFLEYFG